MRVLAAKVHVVELLRAHDRLGLRRIPVGGAARPCEPRLPAGAAARGHPPTAPPPFLFDRW